MNPALHHLPLATDRRRRRPLLLVAAATAILAAATPAAHAQALSAWAQRQEFQVPSAGLVKLSLPPQTLDAARPDLPDLRVADADDRELAYLIDVPRPTGPTVHPPKSFRVILNPGTTLIELETGLAQALDGVSLTSPATGFIKAVQVEGSADGRRWQTLASGLPIFRQPGGSSQLHLPLPLGVWPFLRLSVDDRTTAPVPFTAAELHRPAAEPVPPEPVPVEIVERLENPDETRLTLDLGAAHLPLAVLELDTPEPLFRRDVTLATRQVQENAIQEITLARDTIHRSAVPGQPTTARLGFALDLLNPSRELLVRIKNDDNPPLRLEAVRISRRPVYLIFWATRAGRHFLYTGNTLCPAPRYDLETQRLALTDTGVAPLTLGTLTPNPTYRPPETLPQVQELAGTLEVTPWTFRKPLQLARPGVQQLDLDLEVLAHAQRGFGDLRLVRDGSQVPYVLEHTSLVRTLPPLGARANDPRRPRFSRWSLRLPLAGLPVTRVTCTSPTALFRREFELYEEAKDERGATYHRSLGTASWVRSPQHLVKEFSLTLHMPPTTDTLFLETDDADNPAIELHDFRLAYPVSRLWFKTSIPDGLFLYYGNPRVSAPHYDLSLAARQLLVATKSVATLGVEQRLRQASWAERAAPGQGGILFWGVLILVVIGLLILITRLLPKNPTPSDST